MPRRATAATPFPRQFNASYKADASTASTSAAATRGLPGQHQRHQRRPDRPARRASITQGGAIFANAYARNLQITNNVVQNNGGALRHDPDRHAGPAGPDTNQHNENVRIANNRIIANAGTNLAGGIGIFAGSDGYDGHAATTSAATSRPSTAAGVSVYGLQPQRHDPPQPDLLQPVLRRGRRHHDRRPAADRPVDRSRPAPGAVDIYDNLIQANLANDDGGGIRFLMAGELVSHPR